MDLRKMFSHGFATNRVPVVVPSSGLNIVLRETTIMELKSLAKTIIDNFNRRQMDVIYDAVTDYLESMILTDGVDIRGFTEFDRLYCLMVFFQTSFYRDAVTQKCPKCGTDIVYRYDFGKYLKLMPDAYVEDQTVEIPFRMKKYVFNTGWPSVETMTLMYRHFYNDLGQVTEEMERTQLGINYVLSFIKELSVYDLHDDDNPIAQIDLTCVGDFGERLSCINDIPSTVMFDENDGLFPKITGFFINRLENCFSQEKCPQCHADTYLGLPSSQTFYSMFYGMVRSLYAYILQVECLCLFRYDCCIFDKEQYMTYNDMQTLVQQLNTTMEKDNAERQKVGKDNFTKGLWYIREILNTMIFPEDRKK